MPSTLSALFLSLTLGLGLLACGSGDGGSRSASGPGQKLFETLACPTCHKADGRGSSLGPPLRELSMHWTREQLAEYFPDPEAVLRTNERLNAVARVFTMKMPGVTLPVEQRLVLADYVLELSRLAAQQEAGQ